MCNTSSNHDFGKWGEEIALQYLIEKGYRMLAARYRTPYGEIDLIVGNTTHLVFVEVKARKKVAAMASALSSHQYRRAQLAAEHYLASFPENDLLDIRFDAIMIDQGGMREHIEGIWEISPF